MNFIKSYQNGICTNRDEGSYMLMCLLAIQFYDLYVFKKS